MTGRSCSCFETLGGAVLAELLLLAYAAAVGFVAAGIAASLYKMITLEQARFRLLGHSFLAWITAFAFCALTGPVIVVNQAIQSHKKDRSAIGWLFAGIFVAALWSCCLGVVVLEFALSLRDSLA